MDPIGALTEQIGKWLDAWAQTLDAWTTSIIINTIELAFSRMLPTVDEVMNSPYTVLLGSMFSLANLAVTAVAVFVITIVALTIRRRQGKRISGLLISIVGVVAFGMLFRPVYGMGFDLVQGFGEGMIDVFVQSQDSDVSDLNALLTAYAPGSIIGLVLVGWITAIASFATFIEMFAIRIVLLASIAVFPLLIALKPLNRIANSLFHVGVSAIVTCLFAPILVGFFLGLPIVVDGIIPGAGIAQAKVAIVLACSFLAFISPLVLAYFTNQTSKEVFGGVDAMIAGQIDVRTMPPLSLEENQRSIDRVHFAPLRAAGRELGSRAVHGDIFDDIKSTAISVGSIAASAAGHPYIAAGIQTGDRMLTNMKERREAKVGEYEYSATAGAISGDSQPTSARQNPEHMDS